jgi:hypothetical protein
MLKREVNSSRVRKTTLPSCDHKKKTLLQIRIVTPFELITKSMELNGNVSLNNNLCTQEGLVVALLPQLLFLLHLMVYREEQVLLPSKNRAQEG